jgi:hypothetical protein
MDGRIRTVIGFLGIDHCRGCARGDPQGAIEGESISFDHILKEKWGAISAGALSVGSSVQVVCLVNTKIHI